MIIFEDGIEAIVEQMPNIASFKPNFHWGDQNELNKYIALTDQPYPLIWLVSAPETHIDKGRKHVNRDCTFILATREIDTSKMNTQRLRGSYDVVLNPLLTRFKEAIDKANITTFLSREFQVRKFPNYSEAGKNKTIDKWDAIRFNCNIKMTDINCLNKIQWQKK